MIDPCLWLVRTIDPCLWLVRMIDPCLWLVIMIDPCLWLVRMIDPFLWLVRMIWLWPTVTPTLLIVDSLMTASQCLVDKATHQRIYTQPVGLKQGPRRTLQSFRLGGLTIPGWVFSPSEHEISMKLWWVCESVNQQFKHRCFCFCATELSFGESGGRGVVVEKSGWVSIINDAERGNKVDSLLSSSS